MKKTKETIIEETNIVEAVEQNETESKNSKVGGFIKRNVKKLAVGAAGVAIACVGFGIVKNRRGSSANEETDEEVTEEVTESFEEEPEE